MIWGRALHIDFVGTCDFNKGFRVRKSFRIYMETRSPNLYILRHLECVVSSNYGINYS